ncbi:MAG: hypothetical protein WA208_07310, partial [Thermoanaerobaculia bacterium]
MPRDLLPGVTIAAVPPAVVCDAKSEIARARRFALVRDVAQVMVLLAVDYLFLRFPSTHFPFFDRAGSISMMYAINMLVLAQIWFVRALPRWRARQIAATWS